VNGHPGQFPADPHAVGKAFRFTRFLVSGNRPVALAFGVAATVFAFLPMSAFAEMALGDRGYVREPEAFAVIAAIAMVGGSILGVFRGRLPAGSSSTGHGGE
jgi:hypothetical protein